MIVNDRGVPGQPKALGVTVIVPESGLLPLLVAVNEGIFPMPLDGKPIAGLLFDQV